VILQTPKPAHFFFALPIVTVIEILGRIGILSCPAAPALAFLLAPVVLGTNDDNEAENSVALIVNRVIASLKIRFDILIGSPSSHWLRLKRVKGRPRPSVKVGSRPKPEAPHCTSIPMPPGINATFPFFFSSLAVAGSDEGVYSTLTSLQNFNSASASPLKTPLTVKY